MNTSFPTSYGEFVSHDHPKIRIPIANSENYGIPDEYDQYRDAHQAIRLRYNACVDYEVEYRTSYLKRILYSHDQKELDIQNNALYGFYTSACSCIDSYCYMIFMLGSILKKEASIFQVPERAITTYLTRDAFIKCFINEEVTSTLIKILESNEYVELTSLRNILSHRVSPHRVTRLDISLPSGESKENYEYMDGIYLKNGETFHVNANTLEKELGWLTEQRDKLLNAYAHFLHAHFPPD